MSVLFLQTLPLSGLPGGAGLFGSSLQGILNMAIGIVIVVILISFAIYLYLSAAYSKIGSKAGLSSPGIAWMPFAGTLAVIFESSKMHWWPFLMLVVGMSLSWILMMSSFLIGSALLTIASLILFIILIVFSIMTIVWHWKTYKAVGRPGWWILIPVLASIIGMILVIAGGYMNVMAVSIVGLIIMLLGAIIHLILIGIAAWGENPGDLLKQNPE